METPPAPSAHPGGDPPPDAAPASPAASVDADPPGAPAGYGPPPGYGWTWQPGEPPSPPRRGLAPWLRRAGTAWFVAGVLALTVIGMAVALASNTTAPAGATAPAAAGPGASIPGGSGAAGSGGGRGFGGFGGPGAPGVVGTVAKLGTGSFTVTDRAGTTVTVDEQSSTTYRSGRAAATASAVTVGARVAVQGTRSGSTVTASAVIVLRAGGFGSGFGGAPST